MLRSLCSIIPKSCRGTALKITVLSNHSSTRKIFKMKSLTAGDQEEKSAHYCPMLQVQALNTSPLEICRKHQKAPLKKDKKKKRQCLFLRRTSVFVDNLTSVVFEHKVSISLGCNPRPLFYFSASNDSCPLKRVTNTTCECSPHVYTFLDVWFDVCTVETLPHT